MYTRGWLDEIAWAGKSGSLVGFGGQWVVLDFGCGRRYQATSTKQHQRQAEKVLGSTASGLISH